MSRVVLVKKHGWEQPDGSGSERRWAARWYVASGNPCLVTDDIRKAFIFRTIAVARMVKKGLHLDRLFAARRLPEWLR